tara:strand:+ start:13 stop:264 length:252 start_codon:yes stop_codon:yes gene_type:complete
MKVKHLQQTCICCPSQWEFTTTGNVPVYVRYRWGCLNVRIGEKNGGIWSAIQGKQIYKKRLGDTSDGYIDWSTVEKIINKLEI